MDHFKSVLSLLDTVNLVLGQGGKGKSSRTSFEVISVHVSSCVLRDKGLEVQLSIQKGPPRLETVKNRRGRYATSSIESPLTSSPNSRRNKVVRG